MSLEFLLTAKLTSFLKTGKNSGLESRMGRKIRGKVYYIFPHSQASTVYECASMEYPCSQDVKGTFKTVPLQIIKSSIFHTFLYFLISLDKYASLLSFNNIYF